MCKVLTYIEDMNIYTHLELSMLYQLLRMFWKVQSNNIQ